MLGGLARPLASFVTFAPIMEKTHQLEAFANRLAKNHRHIGKWARRQGITCYRVYDNDIPGTPFAIDFYENALHVAEYARAHGMEPDEHAAWLEACMGVMSETLAVPTAEIFLKYRQRQSGLRQYERFARAGAEKIVHENGLRFIVNLSDYLDTGLFLDHRNTRQMVREAAAGKRVLNLFAYTGAFTTYAAAGGAAQTRTLDMSNTYLRWARRNLSINGLAAPQHEFEQMDVLDWLHDPPRQHWDIIVLDPPTFSNSKRMDGTLDIQRDHVWLLNRTLEHLAPGGALFFSTNFRRFKMEAEKIRAADIRDISKQTVPEDFRNEKIHQCFRLSAPEFPKNQVGRL